MGGIVSSSPRRGSAVTAFGALLRRARAERGLSLATLGDLLGVSAAHLSAVETGRKGVPAGLPPRLAAVLSLPPREAAALERAADALSGRVRVGHLSAGDRELVAALAARLPALPPRIRQDLAQALWPEDGPSQRPMSKASNLRRSDSAAMSPASSP